MNSRRKVCWLIIGGVTCLLAFISLAVLSRQGGNPTTSSAPPVSPSPSGSDSPNSQQEIRLTQDIAVPSNPLAREEDQVSLPSAPPVSPAAAVPPAPDETTRQKMVAGFDARIREATKGLYGGVFQQLHLPANLQEKVIDILTQQEKQLAQQAFEAAQSGNFPSPPSSVAMRAQQVQQDQQLRSVLGDAGFAEFNQYRATIPDRMIINDMNQQGANLSESQSQQLFQVLTEARQQIIGPGITQNLESMSPDQARTIIQQQEGLLQQAIGNRVQNILTPEQASTLQGVFSQHSINRKAQ